MKRIVRTVAMSQHNRMAIFILGPTGVGKTDVAVALAEKLVGEIISLDSRQIYRGMDIGTDKPARNVLGRVRHHLIDEAGPGEYFSAGKFAKLARRAIGDVLSRGKYPVIAGGAGLYLRALLDGLFPEAEKDYAVKERLRREAMDDGPEALYRRLETLDPAMAERLRPGDTQRIVRALEVLEVTGRSLAEHWNEAEQAFDKPFLLIGLNRPRKELYRRIEMRVEAMLDRGLVEEVKRLRDAGYGPELNSQKSVGYREAHDFLNGNMSHADMVRLIKQHTRNYAKRQLTWFKRDGRIRWIECPAGGDRPKEIAEKITGMIESAAP